MISTSQVLPFIRKGDLNANRYNDFQVIFEEGGKYRLVLTQAGRKKSELKFITFGVDEALKFREIYMYLLGILNGFRVKSINL